MASAIAISVVTDLGTTGTETLIKSIVTLIKEVRGSKAICELLVRDIEHLQDQLDALGDAALDEAGLKAFKTLLKDLEEFFQNHKESSLFKRFISNGRVKDRVREFYSRLARVETILLIKIVGRQKQNHDDAMLKFKILEENNGKLLSEFEHLNERLDEVDCAAKRDFENQLEEIERQVDADPQSFLDNLGAASVVSLADLQNELKYNRAQFTKEMKTRVTKILKNISKLVGDSVPDVKRWYISRDDIQYCEDDPFATTKRQSLYHGSLYSGTKVMIQVIEVDASKNPEEIRKRFARSVHNWFKLRDPHVLPLYGANPCGSPLLIVSAHAEHGNVLEYLKSHPHRLWHVFTDVARGLLCLHKNSMVHANLKCSNLLVRAHGVGVVSDFEFAFVRDKPELSRKPQTPSYHWKAPECFEIRTEDRDDNATYASDVYSLGMCLFEAMAGVVPYAGLPQREAEKKICGGELPQCADGKVTDDAWLLIRRMCERDQSARLGLKDIISRMTVLAGMAERDWQVKYCQCASEFCPDCGGKRNIP